MYRILTKDMLTPTICRMKVEAKRLASAAQPGQFLIIRADEQGERIPLTISDFNREEGSVTIVTQQIGASTSEICSYEAGDAFADVEVFLGKCRFSDCRHETEPGCAIKAAIATGELDASRWESYRKLKEEAVDKAEMLRRKNEWHKALRKGEKLKKKEIW